MGMHIEKGGETMRKEKDMKIGVMEYGYFVSVLVEEINEWKDELACMEQNGDGTEYKEKKMDIIRYTNVLEYFLNAEHWAEFANLKLLQMYVDVMDYKHKELTKYLHEVMQKEGGEPIGLTQEEWDDLEVERKDLFEELVAWSTFCEFCEFERIL